jgi:hypothetical protein
MPYSQRFDLIGNSARLPPANFSITSCPILGYSAIVITVELALGPTAGYSRYRTRMQAVPESGLNRAASGEWVA